MFHRSIYCIVELQLVIRYKCCYEKNRFVEGITLPTSFILLIALHFCSEFMLICWYLYRRYLPFFRCSASHTFSLSLCLSINLVSFPPLSSHIKTHGNLFRWSLIAIKSSDKQCCFTQRGWTQWLIIDVKLLLYKYLETRVRTKHQSYPLGLAGICEQFFDDQLKIDTRERFRKNVTRVTYSPN
jgi:hypothetical protein